MKLLYSRPEKLSLASGNPKTWEQVIRVGSFTDPRYGRFDITPQMLSQMIANFQADVYGQRIFVNLSHEDNGGAAGEITALKIQGDWLMALINWFQLGVDANRNKGMIYLSAEIADNYIDNEKGDSHGPVLVGCALTIRPVIKRQKGISLSEDQRFLIDSTFAEQARMKLSQQKQRLQQELTALKLSEAVIGQLMATFEKAANDQTDDVIDSLADQLIASGKTLAEIKPVEQKIEFKLAVGETGLSKEDVVKLLKEQDDARAEKARLLAQETADRCQQFIAVVDAEKGLPEDVRQLLAEEGVKAITPEMSMATVKSLAALHLKLGQQIAVSRQLSKLGFARPAGTAHISLDESNTIRKLQEEIDKRLRIPFKADSERFRGTNGQLQPVNKLFAEEVLKKFDLQWGQQLHEEYKMLAAGSGLQADVALPKVWERTVIREALYQLVALSFCNVGVNDFATEYPIPYSYRDTTAAGVNSTTSYEGQAIQNAGIIQTYETAYPFPQKLAFEVSDEMRYLTQNGLIDFDAIVENTNNAIRIVNESTEARVFNDILQSSDSFGAVAVTNENLELQADGSKKIFITAQFPVCRPRKVYDLKGTQIGNTVNPITVSYNSATINEWPGAGAAAGTYYVLDYNLGEIRLVNQDGTIQTPADGTAYTISYSYATNVYKFDTDLGSLTAPAKWDTFLLQYSLRKSVLEDQRYFQANFGICSGTVFSLIEQAAQFGANSARLGTDLLANGNLGRIKDVPNSKAIAPGIWMGDQRVVIGERGVTRYRLVKPWSMNEMSPRRDSSGLYIGKQSAYGDQFIVLMTPTQLKKAYTSIVLYSGTGRVARAS